MKQLLIIITSGLLACCIGAPAYAGGHGWHGHNRVIIQQAQPSVGTGLGLAAIVGLTLLAQQQPQQAEPLVFPDDPPKKFRRAPSEPKLRNPIPPN